LDNKVSFWNVPTAELLQQLQTTSQGLTSDEARRRITLYGPNLLKPKKRTTTLSLLLSQFKSPIILILIFASALSFSLHNHVDAIIISAIVLVSGLLGFWQEKGATNAIDKLLSIVQIKARVMRDGALKDIPVEEIAPGDIVSVSAGDVIPGDCLLLESKNLFMDEASLTGETYPEDKISGVLPEKTPLAGRVNSLFMGTHVVSGSASAVVVRTGRKTEFGKVSERLSLRSPETEFERGVRRFGYFLMEVTLLLVIAIFAINVYLARPVLDSFLFALALAVGLTPQLLPAIIMVNLAHGAKGMALKKVIVKRLASIENFGSMNVLCSDKTGTLTEGVVHVRSTLDIDGNESEKVLLYAYLNSFYETGFTNPIDVAIRAHRKFDVSAWQKLDEEPYDFVRKRLSILVAHDNTHLMITKGALKDVLAACTTAEISGGAVVDIAQIQDKAQAHFEEYSSQGFRTLGIAYRDVGSASNINKDHESGMTFLGFLVLFDPIKSGIAGTIADLRSLGVSLKIITGDNRLVAAHVAQQVGLLGPGILTGPDLHQMSDAALFRKVNKVNVFAEVEPNHKERIILALKKAGNVVGYMGDGINDASALHTADVGISVDSGVDVAKDAADIVLLEKDLGVLALGVREGRRTFANTLKYVFMATSANFGNMFSMAGASLFLTFLPLLPKQILLTNLMTDFPEMAIAADNVDKEMVERPRRWNMPFIRNFMMTFGLLSSLFDFLTFGVLLLILNASPEESRTGWFVESVISASLVVLVIRTRGPFLKSRPGKSLLIATLLIVGIALALPFIPIGGTLFGFTPLPVSFLALMILIVAIYIASAEAAKKVFYKHVHF
jgi:P-type Mg2+ transporter